MKKIFCVCLGLLLCFMLTACGGSEGETLASDIIVHVEVNPSFDIHVNSDGTIKSVECLNEDAQTVYAEMDLSGVVYEEGFMQLLSAIHEAGFLKEDAQITVEIKQKVNVTYEISKITDAVLEDFNTNVAAIESKVSDEVIEEQESGLLVDLFISINPISVWSFEYEDSQEVLSGVELHLDADNIITSVTGHTSSAEKFGKSLGLEGLDLYEGLSKLFNAMRQNGYLDENKSLLIHADREDRKSELYQFIAQYERENDMDLPYPEVYYAQSWKVMNGDMVTVSIIDGIWHETTEMFEDGVLHKSIIESEGGDYLYREQYYDENGVISSAIFKMANGSYGEQTYDSNGDCIYMQENDVDGKKHETFYENGVPIKLIITTSEYVYTILGDASGNLIEYTYEYSDGRVERYDADGNLISD